MGRFGRRQPDAEAAGRLLARPKQPHHSGPTGLYPLDLGEQRDGLLYVPDGYSPDGPSPLALMLHGAGGNAQHGIGLFRDLADESRLILLAVDSRRQTWDVLHGGFGPDIAFIDRALEQTFDQYAVDPARVAVGGFSDGASYALSVGITNGDLFTHVIAFSPGFMSPAAQEGQPRIYLSHGTDDRVLPIDVCSRRIAPQFKRAGYDVVYREFEGGHTVPAQLTRDALDWFSGETT